MAHLVHTEYVLVGKRPDDLSAVDIFRGTMFCPTVIGSPMGNACTVLKQYENMKSRRYYSSAMILTGFDKNGREILDSAITIRTMEFENNGTVHLNAGATLVKDSDPHSETVETETKLMGALTALTKSAQQMKKLPPKIVSKLFPTAQQLQARNQMLSKFWCEPSRFNLNFLEAGRF